MNMTDEFLRLMRTQREIALATSADNTPHVRIVNFIYVPEEGRIYFATFADNAKVSEIASAQRRRARAASSTSPMPLRRRFRATERPLTPPATRSSCMRSYSVRQPSLWIWSAAAPFRSKTAKSSTPHQNISLPFKVCSPSVENLPFRRYNKYRTTDAREKERSR